MRTENACLRNLLSVFAERLAPSRAKKMLDKPVIITAGTNAEPTKNSISFEAMGANNSAPKAPDTAKAKPIKEEVPIAL